MQGNTPHPLPETATPHTATAPASVTYAPRELIKRTHRFAAAFRVEKLRHELDSWDIFIGRSPQWMGCNWKLECPSPAASIELHYNAKSTEFTLQERSSGRDYTAQTFSPSTFQWGYDNSWRDTRALLLLSLDPWAEEFGHLAWVQEYFTAHERLEEWKQYQARLKRLVQEFPL